MNFSRNCEARGLTPHTIETYKSNVGHFLETNPEPSKISLDALKKYLKGLRARDLAGSTLKGYFAALSTFFEYLIFEGKALTNPILPFRKRYLARIKLQYGGENRRQLISIEAMRDLINLPAEINITTFMLFLAKSGFRRGEMIAMDIQDIDIAAGTFWTKPKAKRTNRLGFLDPEMTVALVKYLEWRKPLAVNNALWIMPNGKRVTKNMYIIQSSARLQS